VTAAAGQAHRGVLRHACRRIREESGTQVGELRAGLRKLADDGSQQARDLLDGIDARQPQGTAQ
jgi:hypothetical protein